MHDILQLCDKYDIILLQELWLSNEDMPLLKTIHPEFDGLGISSMNSEIGIVSGRPYGGIGILWKKSISEACTIQRYDSRLLGLNICTSEGKFCIINVYLPFQCYDNYENYCNYLGNISAIITECDTSNIVIAGDYNAALNTPFEDELLAMCDKSHLVISDIKWFGCVSDTCTYFSASHNTTSWLDHIICSHNAHTMITDMHVHPLPPSSDHHPLGLTLSINTVKGQPAVNTQKNDDDQPLFNWHKAQESDLDRYRSQTNIIMLSLVCAHVRI